MSVTSIRTGLAAAAISLFVSASAYAQPIAQPAPGEPVAPAIEGGAPIADPAQNGPDLDTPVPVRTHFAFGAGAGATAVAMHSDALFLGGGFLSFGADTRVGMFDGILKYERGSTEHGLTAQTFTVGGGFSWALDRIHVGGGLHLGWFSVDRITTSAAFDYIVVGFDGLLSAEIVRADGFSFALAFRPRIEAATQFAILDDNDDTAIGGATLGLEFRLRAPRAPRAPTTAYGDPASR